jgi:hypothetical protein
MTKPKFLGGLGFWQDRGGESCKILVLEVLEFYKPYTSLVQIFWKRERALAPRTFGEP